MSLAWNRSCSGCLPSSRARPCLVRSAKYDPEIQAEAYSGCQGLARDFPAQVSAPRKKPRKDAPWETTRWEQERHKQSSQRIRVEVAAPNSGSGDPRSAGPDAASTSRKPALVIAGYVRDRAATR